MKKKSQNGSDTSENKTSHSLISRVVAVILLIIFLCLIVSFIYMVITGSEYTFSMLFLVIIYPLIIYLFVWLKKVFSRKED